MSAVAIQKANNTSKHALPIFDAIQRKFEAVRRRAFELFQERGSQNGQDLDDWCQAERELMGAPAAVVSEEDGVLQLAIPLPGFDAQDVEVTATPDEVILHAESRREKRAGDLDEDVDREVFLRMETPGSIDTEKVAAKLEKGVLRITAPIVRAHNGKQLTAA